MKVLFLSLFLLLNSFQQLRQLFLQKKKREIYIYSGIMLIAAYLSIGLAIDLYIPNPTNGIKTLFSPIQSWVTNLLR